MKKVLALAGAGFAPVGIAFGAHAPNAALLLFLIIANNAGIALSLGVSFLLASIIGGVPTPFDIRTLAVLM